MAKVKVKKDFTVTHNGMSYSEDTEFELSKAEAERLVKAGAVELIEEEEDTDLETTETDVVSTEEEIQAIRIKKKGSK